MMGDVKGDGMQDIVGFVSNGVHVAESAPSDEEHLSHAVRYGSLNPVRAGLVEGRGVGLVKCGMPSIWA